MGIGTRTEVKQLIKKGQVSVNGTVCKKPEQKVAVCRTKPQNSP